MNIKGILVKSLAQHLCAHIVRVQQYHSKLLREVGTGINHSSFRDEKQTTRGCCFSRIAWLVNSRTGTKPK